MTATDGSLRIADDGVQLANEAEQALTSIVDGVQQLGTAVRDVSTLAADQLASVIVLGQATAKVEEQSHLIATAADEQASSAQSLSKSAGENAA